MKKSSLHFSALFLSIIFSQSAAAAPATFTYQGRILNSDGTPLEYQAVAFEFTIVSPDGSCIIYREQKNGVDMRNSKGMFDTPIGAGTKLFPADPTFNLLSAFINSGSMSCQGGGTYSPLVNDGRVLRVQFHDGIGWRLITPDSAIRTVPFAGYAQNATTASKLGTNIASDFVLKTDIPTCSGSDVLTSTVAGVLTCAAGGGGSGSVTSVATGTGLTGGPITATGTISIAAGGVSTTELASNAVTTVKILDGNVTGAKLETLAGLTAGAYGSATSIPAITVDVKGRVTAISTNSISGLLPAAAGANGKYLKSDGTNWSGADVKFSDIKNGVGTTAFNTGACSANQTVKWSSLTDMFECQNIGSLDASVITAGTIDSARLPAGASFWQDGGSSRIHYSSGNVGIGTATPVDLLTAYSTANDSARISVSTPGTSGNQMAALNLISLSNGGILGTSAANKGWQIFARGNAYSAAIQQNDLGASYWDGSSWTDAFRIDGATGDFGIGTTSPGDKLHVAGKVRATHICATDGTNCKDLTASWGATSLDGLSDASRPGNNIFIGHEGPALTTGDNNVALGVYALDSGTSAFQNVAVGGWAMTAVTTGANNVGVGQSAGYSMTGGSENVAVGADALFTATNGSYNTAIGRNALHAATSNQNVAVGHTAASQTSTGSNNTVVGTAALWHNDTGSYNTILGWNAGLGNSTASAKNRNVFVGGQAGVAVSTADNNILIGFRAGDTLTSGDNNILIGHDIDIPSDTGSNQMSIGNLIFATGVDGTGTTLSTGSVGIGVAAPGYKLDVQGGDINASGSVRSAGVVLTSDLRFKKDIEPLENSLERLLNLRGVSYNWRRDEFPSRSFTDRHQIGVIAQEVEKQFPDLVDTDKKGFKSVNYPALVAPIIEALRELFNKYLSQEQKLSEQQKQIVELQKTVNGLRDIACAKDPDSAVCK